MCRGVAVSRIIDNQHHVSDVIAGALIGARGVCQAVRAPGPGGGDACYPSPALPPGPRNQRFPLSLPNPLRSPPATPVPADPSRSTAGICVALIYILRAIPRYKRVLSPEAGLALEQRSQRYVALPERKTSEQATPPELDVAPTDQGDGERVV